MSSKSDLLRNFTRVLVVILLLIVVSLILSDMSPLEFKDVNQKFEFDIVLLLASPLLVFLLVILDYLKNPKSRLFIVNFFLGLPLSIIALVLVAFIRLSFENSRENEYKIFENRFRQSQKIVNRTSYWDKDQEKPLTFHVTELNRWFQWTQKVDTTSLNRYKWQSLKK